MARSFLAAIGILLVAASTARAVDQAVLDEQQRRAEVVEKVAPTVVAIFSPDGGGGGSGVLITPDGYALTNFHVTSGAGDFMKCGLNDGRLYDAVIVGEDPTGDVALIKLLGRTDFPVAELGDSDQVAVGDWAYAMGNPFLLATDFQPTVTYGIVSGVHRYQYPAGTFLEYTDCIQVDASINPGNSGGPLFNDDGQVIGINGRGSFEKRGRVNSGAGYAISINQIKHFMDHLRSGRVVDHATLGATVRTRSDGSVVVDSILEESEAYRQGLREGDELVAFAGRPIRSTNQFKNILGIYPKGWKLPLTYRRDAQTHDIMVRLRGLHRVSEMIPQQPPMPPGGPKPEKPGDGEKPDDDEQPKRPALPNPFAKKPEAPDEYKHMFMDKPGFANYYFNKLEQDRLLQGLRETGDFSERAGTWTLSGTAEPGGAFVLTLADEAATLELGGDRFVQPLGDADRQDLPPGTGGLLTALHHLRLLKTGWDHGFSDFYYLGSEPLDGRGEPVDVLVTVLSGIESRFYFSKDSGALVGYDTRLAEDVDECEIRFEDVAEFSGQKLPKRLVVRRGGRELMTLTLERAEFAPGKAKRDEAETAEAPKASE